jgi:immunity protein 35 of polymorphic toxin system
MQINRADAVERAYSVLRDQFGEDLHDSEPGKIVLQEELIVEYPTAWTVPFASEHFVKSGDVNYALIPSALRAFSQRWMNLAAGRRSSVSVILEGHVRGRGWCRRRWCWARAVPLGRVYR